MPTIFGELSDAIRSYDASYDPTAASGESVQEHLARVTRYVSRDLPEDGWDALSNETKDWHDKAVEAAKGGADITKPDGYPEPVETRRRRAVPEEPAGGEESPRRRRAVPDDDKPKEPTA